MKWRKHKHRPEDQAREQQLARAEQQVERIRVRADLVVESLQERLRRNHWGDTVAAIARREQL